MTCDHDRQIAALLLLDLTVTSAILKLDAAAVTGPALAVRHSLAQALELARALPRPENQLDQLRAGVLAGLENGVNCPTLERKLNEAAAYTLLDFQKARREAERWRVLRDYARKHDGRPWGKDDPPMDDADVESLIADVLRRRVGVE